MLKNKQFILKNITNKKDIELIFCNDENYNLIKNNKDCSFNNIINLINSSILYEEDILCIVPQKNIEKCKKEFEKFNINNKYDIYSFDEIYKLIHMELSKLHYNNRKHKTRFNNKNKDKYNKNKDKYNKNKIKNNNDKKINNKSNIYSKKSNKKEDYFKKKNLQKKFKNKNAIMNINTIKDINIKKFKNKTILIDEIYKLLNLQNIKKMLKKATWNSSRIIV